MTATERRRGFRRYPDAGWVSGVCAGIADYLGIGVRWVRGLTVLALIVSGVFPLVLVYFVLWYAMDTAPGRPGEPPVADGPYRSTPKSGDEPVEATLDRLERRLRALEAYVTDPDFRLRREFERL